MIPELGHFALLLALGLALVQGVAPLAGAARGNERLMLLARPAAAGQFVFVLLSFAILTHAFLVDDFTVLYVASNSNTALPTLYKVSAVWGAHEGSLLLWCLMLSGWTFAVAVLSQHLPPRFAARVLGVLGLVSLGVLMFTIFTSNPFDRLLPGAVEGRDLNPLLQDPALAIHPPMLYMGYVGLVVAYGFAVAALLEGRIDPVWARWARPWTLAAWLCLTVGIALGSWWAYYELGWGGWWFWDPVENASFMPWLLATALIHSLAITDKRGIFQSWTLLLAIAGFSFSLLGTFLVRSGVLVSVHAFASDPSRGLFILALLGAVTGGALVLYALRASRFVTPGGFKLVSREAFLLMNNILLVCAAGGILLGTIYPLLLDGLGKGKISVGPPYFEAMFLIPMLPLVFLVGVGMHTFWRQMQGDALLRRLRYAAVAAALLTAGALLAGFADLAPLTIVGVLAGLWIITSVIVEPLQALRSGGLASLSRARWGMLVAHLGVGLFTLGVTVTKDQGIEIDRSVKPGETIELADYRIKFVGLKNVTGPNYQAVEGLFEVTQDGRAVAELTPQKRVYNVQRSPMTEASIDAGWRRDIFIALGESLGANAWSVRAQYKPMIRFIWFGCVVMAVGGLLAASDRRYKQLPQPSDAAAASEAPGAPA